ncbi:MAG: hypothetical protein JO297_05785, partial [Nitrososphaeraceae archaeon]|nr:hypothetical protein [Nitrososphaeraceae archaeon]
NGCDAVAIIFPTPGTYVVIGVLNCRLKVTGAIWLGRVCAGSVIVGVRLVDVVG